MIPLSDEQRDLLVRVRRRLEAQGVHLDDERIVRALLDAASMLPPQRLIEVLQGRRDRREGG
jgi:hypothetical protein